MARLRISLVVFVLLMTATQACTPGQVPASTPTLQGTIVLQINSTTSFIDSFGTYHIVGELVNNGTGPASNIELSLEIRDQAGNTLLKDDQSNPVPYILIHPMLQTLAADQSSPFSYSLNLADESAADYAVSISGYEYGFSNRADLESQNVQIVDEGRGWYYLSGELVNKGSQWATINGLAGGVMDAEAHLLSADWSGRYLTELAPTGDAEGRDRTPFIISFLNPGTAVNFWKLYWDADKLEAAAVTDLDISLTNNYFDQYGAYHLVGWVTNSGGQSLSAVAVAGLYSESGIVLDASTGTPVTQVDPGKSVPINMTTFPNVDSSQEQANLVRTQKVEIDPARTYPVFTAMVEFPPQTEGIIKEGATWLVSGTFLNSSNHILSGATVVVTVLDSLGNLVAADFNYILTGAMIGPGESNAYEVYLFLDPMVDLSGYTTHAIIYGEIAP
jgi:hypothetical protein